MKLDCWHIVFSSFLSFGLCVHTLCGIIFLCEACTVWLHGLENLHLVSFFGKLALNALLNVDCKQRSSTRIHSRTWHKWTHWIHAIYSISELTFCTFPTEALLTNLYASKSLPSFTVWPFLLVSKEFWLRMSSFPRLCVFAPKSN